MAVDDRTAQLADLLDEISRLEAELRSTSLRDDQSLEAHQQTIQQLRLKVAQYQKLWRQTSE